MHSCLILQLFCPVFSTQGMRNTSKHPIARDIALDRSPIFDGSRQSQLSCYGSILLASLPVRCLLCNHVGRHTCRRRHTTENSPRRRHVRGSKHSYGEAELTMASILAVGNPSLPLNRRQSISILQSNISETFTPLVTQRWTISVDAQVQLPATTAPTCTLQICLANGACGSKRAITQTWSTFSFVTRMTANEPQTAMFITSCSEPARVALRNIATPDRVLPATTTALLGFTSSAQPPGTSSTSLSTSDPATQPTPLPQEPASTRIRAINLCEYNRPILVSVPENPDYMLIAESGVTYDLGLESGNERLSFTPLNGQALCPNVTRTGSGPAVDSIQCSREGFTYAALPGDMNTLDCESGPGPAPDLFNAVDIRIQTSGSCPAIIRQTGCQDAGDMCLLNVYEGTVDSTFKFLRGPLRIKAIGEGWTSASLQVTASNRATVSYMQERGSFVTIDQDLLTTGTVIQIECDAPLQPKVFSVDVLNTCTRQPYIQAESMSYARLEPGTTGSILVSSGNKFAQVYWQGFFADNSVCVTRRRTAVRRCGNFMVSTFELGELDPGDILELDCPISTVYAKVVNSCPLDNPAIFGTTSAPESVILRATDSFDFNVPATDASATFTSLGGYRMCATGSLSAATACGTDTFTLTGIIDQDTIQLSCPDSPPPLADMSTAIPLSIKTGYTCPNLLVQIGCEGTYCQGLGYVEGYQNVALSYPILSPAARLRVRILGSGSTSIKWTATFGGDPTFLDQVNPQWLEITVPDGAPQIELRTSCTSQGTVINVAVVNYCQLTPIVVKSPAQADTIIQSNSGLYLTTYADFPQLSIEAPGGRNLCAYSYRTGNTQCGALLRFANIGQYDQFDVRCD